MTKPVVNCLIVYAILSLVPQTECGFKTMSYSDECSGSYFCDFTQFTICIKGKCECANPATMIYDPSVKSCVSILHEPCYLEHIFSQDVWYALEGVQVTSKIPCVANAYCNDQSKTCVCKVIKDNGKCKDILDEDSSDGTNGNKCALQGSKCLPNTGLQCKNRRCKCRFESLQYFNGTRCLSRAGGPCQQDLAAKSEDEEKFRLECTPGADCVIVGAHPRCICSDGYVKSRDGLCQLGYGMECSSHENDGKSSCGKNGLLECIEGRCQCPNELFKYDETEKRCLGLVGAPCNITESASNNFCVANSQCVPNTLDLSSCECFKGYYETGNRTCDNVN